MTPKLLTLALLMAAANVSAEPWTYSGTLSDGDKPANGRYDLRVSLLDATRSNPIGSPITFYSVQVKDGAFTVDVDFGSDLSNAPPMLLKTEVSKNSAPFVALGEPSRFDPKVALAGVCWDTKGNTGTLSGTDFLGTVDNVPLVLRVNNQRVGLMQPRGETTDWGEAPSVTMGSFANSASNFGATVAGGGATRALGNFDSTLENNASSIFSTVGGGIGNRAINASATVAGGNKNTAAGSFSAVSGGEQNCAGGGHSWAGGYQAQTRVGNTGGCAPNSGDQDGDEGSFVWNDMIGGPFTSTGPNQFLISADGGVGINTGKLGNEANLRQSELVIRNSTTQANTDISLMSSSSDRGYGIAVVPASNGTSAGDFYISELDSRTPGTAFANRFRIDAAGTTFVQGGAVGNLSDARLKKNIGPIARPLDQLLALQGHVYEYIDPAKAMNEPGQRMGFVAQEVQTVLPTWVKPTGDEGYLAVTPIGFEALAVEAMRDLKAEHDVRMEALEKENTSLRARLEALEAKVKP